MTYIERALGDFTRHVLTDGLKTLFTRRYLPFTLTSLILVFFNSSVVILSDLLPNLATPQNVALLLSLEISVAVAFFVSGLLLARSPLYMRLLAMLTIVVSMTYFISAGVLTEEVVQFFTAFLFIFWIILGTISQFSFFKDLLGHKIFGGILFLGKERDDGKVLFREVIVLVTFLTMVMGYVIFSDGMEQNSTIRVYIGAMILVFGLLNLLPMLHLQRSGDVFFTTLAWFYVIGTVRTLYLVFQLMGDGTQNQSSLIDLAMTLFLVIFAVHKAASTTKDYVVLSEEEEAKKKPNRIVEFFTPSGVFLMILGSALGYHAATMQFRLEQYNILTSFDIQKDLPWTLISHEVTLIAYIGIYAISLFLFVVSPSFRRYANPEIMRIEWLPPYEDMKELIVSISRGEVDYKMDALKLVGNILKDKLASKVGLRDSGGTESHIRDAVNNLLKKSKDRKRLQ